MAISDREITVSSPSGSIGTNLRPNVSFSFNDEYNNGDSHTLHFTVKYGGLFGATIITASKSITVPLFGNVTRSYNDIFGEEAPDLPRGTSMYYEVRHPSGHGSGDDLVAGRSFSTVSSATTLTINRPFNNAVDVTPELQAFATNNYGEEVEATQWTISKNGVVYGTTSPGVNAGIDASILNYADDANWASFTPLTYGQTYTVTLQVTTSDGLVTGTASKNFTIGTYTPSAQITAPITKQNTLTPTITGTFNSSLGNAKTGHKFIVMNTSRTIIGEKTVLADATTPFTTVYTNDGSWSTYTALNWGTQYIFAVQVQDAEGIWSASSESTIKTNSAPSPPTGLLPATGGSVTSLQPQLSAVFQDVDNGDTPTLMEVEVVGLTDPGYSFTRIEADGDETFDILLSDDLVIGDTYSWRVRFTDDGGLQGSWSSWATFTVREGVEVEITHPTPSLVLDTPIQTFTWTYTHPSAVAQASGRLRIYNETGTVPIYDSGTQAGSYLSQELSTTLFENAKTYRARVTVTDANGDTADTGYVYFLTSWTGPNQPTDVTVTPFDNEGYVRIEWQTTLLDDFVYYRVYRRDPTQVNPVFVLVAEIRDRAASQYDYYFAPSGVAYDYAVTIVENSTGAEIESNISVYETETISFPFVTWLNEEYDPINQRVKLEYNPERSETYERNVSFLQPIGRSLPVAHYGRAITHTLQTSFMIRLPYEEKRTLENIIDRGLPVLYRDGRGRKVWVAVTGYTIQDASRSNRGTLQLNIQRISTADK